MSRTFKGKPARTGFGVSPPGKVTAGGPPIDRRRFLGIVSACGLGCWVPMAHDARPNFLFVISDQFRADALGVAGNTFVRTPNLDELAQGGIHFSNAYCPQALCTPSRGSLFSGVYPHTTHLDYNIYGISSAFQVPELRLAPIWPVLLREAGYTIGFIGKWHLGEANPGFFDYWNGYNSNLPHWLGKPNDSVYRSDNETEDAIRFLKSNASRPFALIVSYYPPHTPYDPPRKFQDLYSGRVDHADYYGGVSAIDYDVGRLLTGLHELGLDQDTMVSFTADHGETFGSRLGSKNKTVSYEESAKVPLLLRWPRRLPAGRVYEGGVSTVDLMPTILEAAGLPAPARLQGRSRLGEIERGETGWAGPVFVENITELQVDGRPAAERAVRLGQWKLILRDHPRDELYNLQEDPGEHYDLLATPGGGLEEERAAKTKELATLLHDWGERTDDPMSVKLANKYL